MWFLWFVACCMPQQWWDLCHSNEISPIVGVHTEVYYSTSSSSFSSYKQIFILIMCVWQRFCLVVPFLCSECSSYACCVCVCVLFGRSVVMASLVSLCLFIASANKIENWHRIDEVNTVPLDFGHESIIHTTKYLNKLIPIFSSGSSFI